MLKFQVTTLVDELLIYTCITMPLAIAETERPVALIDSLTH